MHRGKDTDEKKYCGEQRIVDDGSVRDATECRHDKSGGTHHRRHELSPGGGQGFHSSSEFGPIARFLHHGYGYGACGGHICGTATRDRTHETAGNDGHLRWPTRHAGSQSSRYIAEEVGTAPVHEDGPKDNEKGNFGRRHAQRYTKDPTERQVVEVDQLNPVNGRRVKKSWEIGPDKRINEKGDNHVKKSLAKDTPRRLKHQEDHGYAEDFFVPE